MERTAQNLNQAAGKIGLKINIEKTKVMKLLDNGSNTDIGALTLEKVNKFRYLRAD